MPIYERVDRRGRSYYQYGNNGARYYFHPLSELSRTLARKKAVKQAAAIHANRYK